MAPAARIAWASAAPSAEAETSSPAVPKCLASTCRAVCSEKAQAGRRVTIIRSLPLASAAARPSSLTQTFGRGDPRQLVGQLPRGETGRHEPAGGKLDPRQPRRIARRNRRQKIALPRIQQGVVGHGAGRDDPRHLAAHQPLGQLGVFHLLAHGRPHAGRDQLAQVALQLVMRKAGHGDGVVALFAAGQGEVQHAGGRLGVVVEHLVEVAHAKQQQRLGTRPLRFLILLHHGGDGHADMLTVAAGAGKGGEQGRGKRMRGWIDGSDCLACGFAECPLTPPRQRPNRRRRPRRRRTWPGESRPSKSGSASAIWPSNLRLGRRLHGVEHPDDAEQTHARLLPGAGEAALDGGGHVADDFGPGCSIAAIRSTTAACRSGWSKSISSAARWGRQSRRGRARLFAVARPRASANRSSASRPCKN